MRSHRAVPPRLPSPKEWDAWSADPTIKRGPWGKWYWICEFCMVRSASRFSDPDLAFDAWCNHRSNECFG